MDKKAFIEMTQKDYDQWDSLLGQIDPERMQQPGAWGELSIKDLVAHITWYEREMVNVLEKRDFNGSDLWDMPLDSRNRAIYEASHEKPLNAVLEDAHQVHARLVTELEKLSEEDLTNPVQFKDMPKVWIPWQVIASNTYEHYKEHLGDLQGWINAS